MLNTWEASYFRRPGLRVFFMVPRTWTDATLPLKVKAGDLTEKMVVERAMIGRIELVTPAQRDRLLKITRTPPSDAGWLWKSLEKARASRADAHREDWLRKLMDGETTLAASNVEMPNEFRDYLELGRFRNALILDELTRRPSANLKQFVEQYGLKYSEVDLTVAQ